MKKNQEYRYVWWILLEAYRKNLKTEDIKFIIPKENLSPYFEINDENINFSLLENKGKVEVNVNPFHRFTDIFFSILDENTEDNLKVREELINFMLHILADTDLMSGLNLTDIIATEIMNMIEDNEFGEDTKKCFNEFTNDEKLNICRIIYEKRITDNSFEHLKKVMKYLYNDSLIYNHLFENNFAIYINKEKTKKEVRKVKFIKKFFIPVTVDVKIFWEKHFGIIDVVETMTIGEMLIY